MSAELSSFNPTEYVSYGQNQPRLSPSNSKPQGRSTRNNIERIMVTLIQEWRKDVETRQYRYVCNNIKRIMISSAWMKEGC